MEGVLGEDDKYDISENKSEDETEIVRDSEVKADYMVDHYFSRKSSNDESQVSSKVIYFLIPDININHEVVESRTPFEPRSSTRTSNKVQRLNPETGGNYSTNQVEFRTFVQVAGAHDKIWLTNK